jgi:hypothetical protein
MMSGDMQATENTEKKEFEGSVFSVAPDINSKGV